MTTFSSEQLNFFKFSTVVLEEFPIALRQVFAHLWDTLVAPLPGFKKWDDSPLVRNLFLNKEGGKTKYIPTSKSFHDWDCTALFEATLYSKSCSVPDGKGAVTTLAKMYVTPRGVPHTAFHPSVLSPSGNKAETHALALDQLRRLRNTLCHQNSTRQIVKADFDSYIHLAKDAFHALGLKSTKIDDVGKLGEKDFPTARLQQLEDELRAERFKPIEDMLDQMRRDGQEIKKDVTHVKAKVEDVATEVKTAVTDAQTKVEDVATEVKTAVTDVKTEMEDVATQVKTAVTGVQTKVEDVGNQVKTAVTDVKTEMEDVATQVKTAVTGVQTKVEDVGTQVKTAVTDVQTKLEDVGNQVKTAATDVKAAVKDVQSKIEDVGSDVKTVVRDVGFNIDLMRQAMQERVLGGSNVPQSCIPDKIPNFIGRQEECKEIQNHLIGGTTRIVNVWGPPAFGKTSVAINVAHQLRENNIPVYFLPLRGMTTKEDLVSKLLSMFADNNQVPHTSPSHWLIWRLQQVRTRQKPLILIWDNADDLLESEDAKQKQHVVQFIHEILAQCSHIKLLLTTRASLDFLNLTIPVNLAKIDVLDQVSSASLIKLLLPDVTEDICKCIVQECGQVPLAIRLMCNIIKEEHTSINQLSEELRNSTLVNVLDDERFPADIRLKILINKSFQRLSIQERKAFVSLTVFPGWFNTNEATAVLDVKTDRATKKVIRSLERNSLISCGESFSRFTIHSLFRSFVEEQRRNDKTIEAMLYSAQHRFNDYYISCFANANEKFLTGPSNEAWEMFAGRRGNILFSITNGIRDDDLYSKIVKVLSMAELFLCALLSNEVALFEQLYDTALLEAKQRQMVEDEWLLLASKSFRYWGWFSLDWQPWDDSLSADYSNNAFYPAKLICYQSIYQLLCGNREEGIMSIFSALDGLSCCRNDEIVLKHLIFTLLERILDTEEANAPPFRKLRDQSHSYWEARMSRILSTKDETAALHNLLDNKDLFFLTLWLLTQLALDHRIRAEDYDMLFVFNKLIPRFCENQVPENLPCEIRFLISIFKESFETLSPLFPEVNWFTLESATQAQLESLRLHFLEFTDKILHSGVDSAQSYIATKLLMKTLLQCLELFPDFPSFITNTIGKNVVKYFNDTFDEVLNRSSERVPDTDLLDLARSYDSLGKLKHLFIGSSAAIESHKEAIRIREEHFGNHIDTVASLTDIGCSYRDLNKAIEAGIALESALDLRKQLGVYDHEDTAYIYASIGENQSTLANYEEALNALLKAVKIRKEHLGQHRLTAKTLSEAAKAYLKLQSYPEALQFCEQAFNMRLDLLGEDVDTADSFNLLGCIHLKMGENVSAIQSLEGAVEMRTKLLGYHKDTACSYHNLGVVQREVGDQHGALGSLQKAADIRSKQLGSHVDTASSYHWLGVVQHETGDVDGALKSLTKAAEVRLKELGDHLGTASSYHWLGIVQHDIEDFDGALESLTKAAEVRSKELGDHEDTASSYHWLGVVQRHMGEDIPGALGTLEKAAIMRSNHLGDHEDTADSYHNVGAVQYLMGDHKKASEFLQRAAHMRSNLPGDQKNTASTYHLLGSVQYDMKDIDRAVESLQKAWQLRNELLGEYHPDTVDTLQLLSRACEASLLHS